ncbi:ribonuclease HII [Barrientosiimonas marina]
MKQYSIAQLKQLFAAGHIDESWLNELKSDNRKGVQKLIKQYERQRLQEQALEENFRRMSRYEQALYAKGCHYIAGIDEAGRGPLAGPVVASAVILPPDFKLLGLNDSKQLTEKVRNDYFTLIKQAAVSYGIAIIDNQTIDVINISEAANRAMYEAVDQLDPSPDHILIDAVPLHELPTTSDAITKGDQRSISIAAASILAKVTRDQLMKEIAENYPEYGFKSNMGYGTKQHLETLKERGVSPYHRRTFAPVRDAAK